MLPFEPRAVEEGLKLCKVPAWLEAYSSGNGNGNTAGPIALVRIKPDASPWHDVLVGLGTVEGLSDADVKRLAYLVPGGQAGDRGVGWAATRRLHRC